MARASIQLASLAQLEEQLHICSHEVSGAILRSGISGTGQIASHPLCIVFLGLVTPGTGPTVSGHKKNRFTSG
jgi:hypothetical protein